MLSPDAACGLERLRQGLPAAVILDLPRPESSGRDSGNGRRRNLLPVCARQSGVCRASVQRAQTYMSLRT